MLTLKPPFLAKGLLLLFSIRRGFSEEKAFFAPGRARSTIEAADVPECDDVFGRAFFGWGVVDSGNCDAS